MSIFNKTNGIEITQEDLNDAKVTAGLFDDELIKKRAFANVIGARCAMKLLFSMNIEASNLYSMYTINKMLETIDIADIYANGIKIDARIINDENEIFIPKSHSKFGIEPDLYVVFKLEKDLSYVEFLGCINPEEMDKSKENKDYYFVDDEFLYNLKIFKNLVKGGTPCSDSEIDTEDFQRAENLIIPFEDNDIFNADKEFLIQQLSKNIDLRKKAIEFENFEFVSKKVVTEETVYGDSVLGLVGSEKLYNKDEFNTNINLDELSDITVDDFVESFKDETSAKPQDNNSEVENFEEINVDEALKEFYGEDDDIGEITDTDSESNQTEDFLPIIQEETDSNYDDINYDEIDFDGNDFDMNKNENSKLELENMINEISDLTDSKPEPDSESIEDSPVEEVSEPQIKDETEDYPFETLPDEDDDEYEDEDEDYGSQHDGAIEFEETGFELPELGGFSIDEDDSEQEDLLQEEELTIKEPESHQPEPQYDNYDDEDDDVELADLPTLKVFQESPETYKKKMYKAPKMDDIDLTNVNLDDFDDYETEDKEQEEHENEEFDEMLSDLDNILNTENLPIDDVGEILEDEELKTSLESIEEIPETEKHDDTPTELEISENSPILQDQQQENQDVEADNNITENPTENKPSESGMSLDDFLNSSSFNEMSTNENINDNIKKDELGNIYQQEIMDNTEQTETSAPDKLLTDESNNSDEFYQEDTVATNVKPKPKSNTPKLLAILIVLLCVFAYTKKDDIMQNFNFAPKEEVPEFDLNNLKEPAQPAETENPIPTLPQPTDMPQDPSGQMPPTDEAAPSNIPQPAAQTPSEPVPHAQGSNKISKISWEVPESVANNPKIRKYLQIAGRTLKLTLQNDLLVATELPFSNRVMLDLTIAPSGNLITSDFVISSGSKQIDNIVLQSVKDTLKYVRPPLGEIQSPNSKFTLIINF